MSRLGIILAGWLGLVLSAWGQITPPHWFVPTAAPEAASTNCSPSLPTNALAYWDVLCPTSIQVQGQRTNGATVSAWLNTAGNPLMNLINDRNSSVRYLTSSENSNNTACVFFDSLSAGQSTRLKARQAPDLNQPTTILWVGKVYYTNSGYSWPLSWYLDYSVDQWGGLLQMNDTNQTAQMLDTGIGMSPSSSAGSNALILTAVYDGPSSYLRTNGVQSHTGDMGPYPVSLAQTFYMGAATNFPNVYAGFAVWRCGIWYRALSSNEVVQVETNAAKDFGLPYGPGAPAYSDPAGSNTLYAWWVYTDLATNNCRVNATNAWIDRISQKRLSYFTNGTQFMTNTPNGMAAVSMDFNHWGGGLTNDPILAPGSNSTVSLIFEPLQVNDDPYVLNIFSPYPMNDVGQAGRPAGLALYQSQFHWSYPYRGGAAISSTVTRSNWYDVTLVQSNSTVYCYTQGLYSAKISGYTPPVGGWPWQYLGGSPEGASVSTPILVREVLVWSNTVLSAGAISILHKSDTNVYGYSP